MRQLKTLLLAVFALAALGVFAASANATLTLPTVLYVEGTEGVLEGSSKTAVTEFFGIVNLKGTGWLITTSSIPNMANLWKTDDLFTNVVLGSTKCNTAGDNAGEVLLTGNEEHLVWVRIPGTNLWVLGILVLVKEELITCGTTKIKVRGEVLSRIEPGVGTVVEPSGHFTGTALCSKEGAPEYTEYLNDNDEAVAVKLESNGGLGWQKSCELIEGKIELSPSRSVEVMEP